MNQQLILVRHAIAVDRDEYAQTEASDIQRPLTPTGRRRMRRAAGGLRQLVPEITRLATSPYLRATQTAQILAASYGLPPDAALETPLLTPGAHPEALGRWLAQQPPQATWMLVGHEPELSQFTDWLLAGALLNCFSLKKGGALCLGIPQELAPACATLRWLATPALLRRLGARSGAGRRP